MRVLLAVVSAWFPLTSVPSVATVDWRCGAHGEQLRVTLTPPIATTTIVFRRRRHILNGGSFTTPWLHGAQRVTLEQGTEARTLTATLDVSFGTLGYCWGYLPPPFRLQLERR